MELKQKCGIENTKTAIRIMSLKEKIRLLRRKNISYEELLKFLESLMNFEEMQMWLLKKEIQNEKITFNDKLDKFFELKTDENILEKYDIEQMIKNERKKR
jgi:hypothetical protein